MVGTNQFRSSSDRTLHSWTTSLIELNDMVRNIQKLSLSTHMIELDDGVLSLKESIRFFSLSRFRPTAEPYFLPFSIYDILIQLLRLNNLRTVSFAHIINSIPLFSDESRHIELYGCWPAGGPARPASGRPPRLSRAAQQLSTASAGCPGQWRRCGRAEA